MLRRLDVDVSYASELVTACCVLHDICEIHGEIHVLDDQWMKGVERQDLESTLASASSNQQAENAMNIWAAFMSYFNQ